MTSALIIEDEKLAAEHLQGIIGKCDAAIHILAVLDSIDASVKWIENNQSPHLIFMDIQLSDGLCFEIFNSIRITCPVIFTTSYEEYTLKAFKVNSVDYLLKPVTLIDCQYAINQYKTQNNLFAQTDKWDLNGKVDRILKDISNRYKSRFIANAGTHIRSIEVENINCFYSLGKSTFLQTKEGTSYDIIYSLEQLESLTDPKIFFRVNRQYLVNISAIKDIMNHSVGKIRILIKNEDKNEIFVSRNRIKEFKQWLDE